MRWDGKSREKTGTARALRYYQMQELTPSKSAKRRVARYNEFGYK